MKKRVYFVRHAESETNVGNVPSKPDTMLTEYGREQARITAKRFANIKFEKLISSTYPRAIDTAQEISQVTGKTFETKDFLIERVRPSETLNMTKGETDYIASHAQYEEHFLRGETYKDGEGYNELIERARQTFSYLESLSEQSIVVVTHGMFLKVLMAYAVLGDAITPVTCYRFFKHVNTKNTGISLLEFDSKGWKVIVWNDHAHFGEY
ncbi:MAG: hypothetical protein RL094_799 [Candidatus Parcubacteria bacterium]|jgi:broad specificity phosphatase PhoE